MNQINNLPGQWRAWCASFWRRNWKGTAVILLATLVFFWPLVLNVRNYSLGGDAMFNAWTLARNHHCLLRQECPSYADANIYFPNKDTMLYSETQLSAGLVSLPLHFIDPNPIFAYNVMTILSIFLAGWFMYLLAKRLSKGNELFSILAGLLFAFAPHRLAGLGHLQNLCIFCLPLAVLFILKYFERPRKLYLAGLFVTLLYLFFGSWYQMVFGIMAIAVFTGGAALIRMVSWQAALRILAVAGVAALMTLPLALQYVRFSNQSDAKFGLGAQVTYSSSVADYFMPNSGTLLGGFIHDRLPGHPDAYNPDSVSYHGFVLYAAALAVLVLAFRLRKKGKENKRNYHLTILLLAVAVVGVVVSLGPLLKLAGSYHYAEAEGYRLVIPLPYLGVDILLPQLSFIRAIGRASVLVLFALCALLALVPVYLKAAKAPKRRSLLVAGAICFLIVIDLLPTRQIFMSPNSYNYNLNIPAVYSFIKKHPEINNLIVLRTNGDYPGALLMTARVEDLLWAGYHNRNLFNGYSGYRPPHYMEDYADFVDFREDDPAKLRKLHLRYVLVDKLLSTSNPSLIEKTRQILKKPVYEDSRYVLYKL